MITAHGNVDTAVEAMKHGAFDFITKPFDAGELRAVIRKAVNTAVAELDSVSTVPLPQEEEGGRYGMIGTSESMSGVYKVLDMADSPTTVLITGESGTGKELVAQPSTRIHSGLSVPYQGELRRHSQYPPRVRLLGTKGHSGAIASKPGRFDWRTKARCSWMRLRNPTEMQVKLLRVIQEGTFERVGGLKTLEWMSVSLLRQIEIYKLRSKREVP